MMKKYVIAVCDVLLYLFTFLAFQFVFGAVLGSLIPDQGLMLVLTSTLSSLVLIPLFVGLRWVWWQDMKRRIGYRPMLLSVFLAFALVFPADCIEKALGVEMPEQYRLLFEKMLTVNWSFLSVAILTPVAEELLFRGAILRRIHMVAGNQWVAIVISAFLFGIMHGNLAQFVHAFIIGILLGWLYCRYKSLLPSLLFHIVNNTVAFTMILLGYE